MKFDPGFGRQEVRVGSPCSEVVELAWVSFDRKTNFVSEADTSLRRRREGGHGACDIFRRALYRGGVYSIDEDNSTVAA
jgi:hypothetical protein